jgi:hypothetical protein
VSALLDRLERLGREDPVVAPLTRLERIALAAEPPLADQLELSDHRLADGLPLLHGRALPVDLAAVGRLDRSLETAAGVSGVALDPRSLIEASVVQDAGRLAGMAEARGLDPPVVALLGHLAALPLLRACGRAAAPLLVGLTWDAGYCPVCAAWPTFAELRGLERQHWLRCGRCASGWRYPARRCAFCGTRDTRSSGYLAPEANRESRRARTCAACEGYLKTVAVFEETAPEGLGVVDLTTLELDTAALMRGYRRPEGPGFPLGVQIVPEPPSRRRRLSWPS